MTLLRTGVLAGLVLAAAVLPVFRLPTPTGVYRVGTRLLGPGVQLWYPAAAPRGRSGRYCPDGPGTYLRLLSHVRTNSRTDVAVAPGGPYPVLVYVNGWGGTRWENTALLEDLASHGYIVAAADQPTGRVAGVLLDTPMDSATPARWAGTEAVAAVKLRVQAEAVTALLDRLTTLNGAGGDFAGHLDLDHIGALGFSFGGATVAEAAMTDRRLSAVVNMDGLLFGQAGAQGVAVPYLEFSDDTPVRPAPEGAGEADRTLANIQIAADAAGRANLARRGGWLLTVAGTLHANFSDYPALVPVRRLSGAGPIAPARAATLIHAWTIGFFDHAWRNRALPDAAATPELRLEHWPRPNP